MADFMCRPFWQIYILAGFQYTISDEALKCCAIVFNKLNASHIQLLAHT